MYSVQRKIIDPQKLWTYCSLGLIEAEHDDFEKASPLLGDPHFQVPYSIFVGVNHSVMSACSVYCVPRLIMFYHVLPFGFNMYK